MLIIFHGLAFDIETWFIEKMAAKEETAAAKKPTKVKTHPTYLEMAKEAINSLSDKKGSSVPSIQSYIAGKYAIDADTVRVHLKPALAKGLENGAFERPKNSDAKGYTGRFKVNKVKANEEEKAKKAKLKEKVAKEKKATAKPKTVAKKAGVKKSPSKVKATDKAKKVTKKTVGKKSPAKTKKSVVEKKPKAAKATLKTPKKTTKTLKAKKTNTPAASSSKKSKK